MQKNSGLEKLNLSFFEANKLFPSMMLICADCNSHPDHPQIYFNKLYFVMMKQLKEKKKKVIEFTPLGYSANYFCSYGSHKNIFNV